MTIGHGTTAWQPPVFRTETIAHPDEDETAALRDFSPVFVGSGSQPAFPLGGHMSAYARCGHGPREEPVGQATQFCLATTASRSCQRARLLCRAGLTRGRGGV